MQIRVNDRVRVNGETCIVLRFSDVTRLGDFEGDPITVNARVWVYGTESREIRDVMPSEIEPVEGRGE